MCFYGFLNKSSIHFLFLFKIKESRSIETSLVVSRLFEEKRAQQLLLYYVVWRESLRRQNVFWIDLIQSYIFHRFEKLTMKISRQGAMLIRFGAIDTLEIILRFYIPLITLLQTSQSQSSAEDSEFFTVLISFVFSYCLFQTTHK